MYKPRPFAADVDSGTYWRPKTHLGRVHAAICTGDTRSLSTEYGQSTASVVAHMLVWATSLDGDPEYRYDDVYVLQSHLAAQCRERGLAVGRLVQPDRRYEFEQLHHSEWDRIGGWLAANVDGETGEVTWTPGKSNGQFVPPDEAPF